jgi:nicotinamidase-related amidase
MTLNGKKLEPLEKSFNLGLQYVKDKRGKVQLRRKFSPEIEVKPDKIALLIIDAQNKEVYWDRGYHHIIFEAFGEDAASGTKESWEKWGHWDPVAKNIIRLLKFFREHKLTVIHTFAGCFTNDMRDMENHLGRYYREVERRTGKKTAVRFGDPNCEIINELKPQIGEIVLEKRSGGPWSSSPIDQILLRLGIEQIIIVGGATTGCTFISMVEAYDHGYDTFTILDANFPYSPSDEHRDRTLTLYNGFTTLWDTEDIHDELKKALA